MTTNPTRAARLQLRLQLSPSPDALVRVLDVVLAAQAKPRTVSHIAEVDCGWALLDLECPDVARADLLMRRLGGLVCVEQLQQIGARAQRPQPAASARCRAERVSRAAAWATCDCTAHWKPWKAPG